MNENKIFEVKCCFCNWSSRYECPHVELAEEILYRNVGIHLRLEHKSKMTETIIKDYIKMDMKLMEHEFNDGVLSDTQKP